MAIYGSILVVCGDELKDAEDIEFIQEKYTRLPCCPSCVHDLLHQHRLVINCMLCMKKCVFTCSYIVSTSNVSLISHTIGTCQDDCTHGFPDVNSAHQNTESFTHQLVVPHYTFQCSAVITAWEAIVHIEKELSTVQFQVWRRNRNQTGYWLVGSNTFSRKHEAPYMQKEIRNVYIIVQEPQIHVEPGDMVGVLASGLNVHYEVDDGTEVYLYSADNDFPRRGLSTPLNMHSAFNRILRGAPLIAVQLGN